MSTIKNSPEQRETSWDRKLAQMDYDTQMESARNKGESLMAALFTKLIDAGRADDAFRAAEDKEYREKLYKEFQLVQ